jgi:ketosteroid isomerase-like protein
MRAAEAITMTLLKPSSLRNWGRGWRNAARSAAAAALALLLLGAAPLLAQKQKNQKDSDKKAAEVTGVASLMPLPDTQAIELEVSQMLAAWQIGDADILHTFYADDVLVVSGAWEQPLQGWQNYLNAYQSQRARTQSVRLERTNTFTKVQGDTAWCTYQWQFGGQVDGAQSNAFGQTTLVLQKRAGKWLIVLNHTSMAPTPARTTALPSSTQPVAGLPSL